MKSLQSQKSPPSLKFDFHLQALKIGRRFGIMIQAYSGEKIMEIEYLIQDIMEDLKG